MTSLFSLGNRQISSYTPDAYPGSLALVTDHINLSGMSPLHGASSEGSMISHDHGGGTRCSVSLRETIQNRKDRIWVLVSDDRHTGCGQIVRGEPNGFFHPDQSRPLIPI